MSKRPFKYEVNTQPSHPSKLTAAERKTSPKESQLSELSNEGDMAPSELLGLQ